MIASVILGGLALISLALTIWQWLEARRFPLHQRVASAEYAPPVTLLKPLKGADAETEACLRSWLCQEYRGQVQALFGVASEADPACAVVRRLQAEFPAVDSRLVICPERLGGNAKASKLAQLERLAAHDLFVISDADVRVPGDFLANLVAPFRDGGVVLVNPFYRLANPSTPAMRWEALGINADFWSSVLQACRLRPLRFALGAVMAVQRRQVETIGGFRALSNHLADDYELGRRVAANGGRIVLCPVVVDCCDPAQGWAAAWRHQLRWARTIRACQPLPYALSLLSNATLWPLLWFAAGPGLVVGASAAVCVAIRVLTGLDNQRRLTQSIEHLPWCWLAPVKDLLQCVLWALAFAGNTVEWRGERYRVTRSGELA